jgi:dihydrofolate reductase
VSATSASPRLPRLELIVAMAANRVIGRGGQLPWHLPDDLKHFKQLTMGHPIIMGRRTCESIGKPLPGRRNIVISATLSAPPHPDVVLARSLDAAISLVGADVGFIIGGAALYAAAIPRVQRIHVTELDDAIDGDVFFPCLDLSQWRVIEETRHHRDPRHAFAFCFRTYERIRGGAISCNADIQSINEPL